jgi:16S rRNA (cytosine967-C5)-methyltransferase
MTGRGLMLGLLRAEGQDVDSVFTGQGHALPVLDAVERDAGRAPEAGPEAVDLPDWLWLAFQDAYGDRAAAVAHVLQTRAPVMLRVNLRKTTCAAAQAALAEDGVVTAPDPVASTALRVLEGARQVGRAGAYLAGLVELQDGASQAIIDKLHLPERGKILDFCAGGGGKALAIAARTEARIMAHDIQPARMKDMPARALRAGVTITQVEGGALPGEAPFDLILCDAPCSGSGAWRRAPEGKWALTPERLAELTALQAAILSQAAALVAPGGVLAYATCSVLRAENEDSVAGFLTAHPAWHLIASHRWEPGPSGDGFYLAQLQRRAAAG